MPRAPHPIPRGVAHPALFQTLCPVSAVSGAVLGLSAMTLSYYPRLQVNLKGTDLSRSWGAEGSECQKLTHWGLVCPRPHALPPTVWQRELQG